MKESPLTPLQSDEELQIQSEKLKAIGQMTAGIVHDLNNIFHGILGYANAIQLSLVNNNPVREHVKQIMEIAELGKKLVSQVLAFSRKTPVLCEPVDVHSVLENVVMLCAHGIDKMITIKKQLTADSFCVNGNRAHLESAFLNLMINARDAMPRGGVISVTTQTVVLDVNSIEQPVSSFSPGSYIHVSLSDSGTGMDSDVLSHIFETFFTTKEKGKGTGLGLSRVKECIELHKGHIQVISELGKGTNIEVYLPLIETIRFPASKEVPSHPEGAVSIVAEVLTCKKKYAKTIKTIPIKED